MSMTTNTEPPADVVEAMEKMGRVEWGAVQSKPDSEHVSDFADSLAITRKEHGTEGDQSLHGLYLKGTETVLCHTGTSPNSAANAQVLAHLWNSALSAPPAPSQSGLVERARKKIAHVQKFIDNPKTRATSRMATDLISLLEEALRTNNQTAPDQRYGKVHTDGSRSGGQPPALDELVDMSSEVEEIIHKSMGKDFRRVGDVLEAALDDGLVGELRNIMISDAYNLEERRRVLLDWMQEHGLAILSALTAKDHTALLGNIRSDAAEIVETTLCKGARILAERTLTRIDQALATEGDGE